MSLKIKILLGYGVAFALMGLVVLWCILHLISLGRASEAILRENYRSILAAEQMIDALERQDSHLLTAIMGEPGSARAAFLQQEAIFDQWLERARDNVTVKGEAELIEAIATSHQAYGKAFSTVYEDATNPRNVTLDHYTRQIHPIFEAVLANCIALRQVNEDTMYAASQRTDHLARRAIWSTIAIALLALVVVLTFSLVLAEHLVGPLRSFALAAQRLSRGDYTVRVPIATRDELGQVASEFNRMTAQLEDFHRINIEEIVSERNKGEAILHSIADGLVVFDTQRRVGALNPAARQILNLGETPVAGLHAESILHDNEVVALVRETLDAGAAPEVDERRVTVIDDGEKPRHYLYSVTPIRGAECELIGIVLLLKDITSLRELEQLKSEFVTAASHELRTPLTSIGMSVDLLLEHAVEHLPARELELLEAAHEEVHRMQALVNDLLDLSRIEASGLQLEFTEVGLRDLFDHVKAIFQNQADRLEVRLAYEPVALRVRGDATKLTWVLTNLVSNALRYVGSGGRIELEAEVVGQLAHVRVRDDGPGIPEAFQTRIFQKFVQVEGPRSAGSGLGLAICREIVRAHGGAIWVESEPGAGSTFTFSLPLAHKGGSP